MHWLFCWRFCSLCWWCL